MVYCACYVRAHTHLHYLVSGYCPLLFPCKYYITQASNFVMQNVRQARVYKLL